MTARPSPAGSYPAHDRTAHSVAFCQHLDELTRGGRQGQSLSRRARRCGSLGGPLQGRSQSCYSFVEAIARDDRLPKKTEPADSRTPDTIPNRGCDFCRS